MDKALVLGNTGKLGRALVRAFANDFEILGGSASTGLDAGDPEQVARLLESVQPEVVLNAIALNGLDACERDPERALRLNTLLPKALASRSQDLGFKLIHFSSDTVFDGQRRSGCYVESDPASPINVYGLTKFGGDCFVQARAKDFYIFRLSVLAGPGGREPQLLERLIARARAGEALAVADNIVCSPSSSQDVADGVRQALRDGRPPGLYHLVNAGSASLFELVQAVLANLDLKVRLRPVSHREFPSLAPKNLYTPLGSEKAPPLRPWREAMQDYCREL